VSGVDPRTPCIIGVAQRTDRSGASPEPLLLWEEVCRAAAADSGATGVLDAIDSLQIVYCQSWQYDSPPDRLAAALGISPRHRFYSGIGGTTPQVLVEDTAASMLRGECDVALITGAEALETVRQFKKAGEKPPWSHRDPDKKPFPFEAPFHPAEVAHSVFQAWLTFPVFDIARRAALDTPPDAYRAEIGELLAPMTAVAEANPYAWFRSARTADELMTVTPANRMVGYPYTKFSVSIMDVDMAAAVVLTTHAAADRLGVPAERRVYLRGWCYATDPVYLAEHRDLASSPAMVAASQAALGAAGIGIDDVGHFDLYSCFASSVHFACDALGISPLDDRGMTVTGGLPFCGGAGSDYMTHSIAAMTDVLRGDPGSFGLVSGVGMHMTKHVYGLYSTTPGPVAPPPDVQGSLPAALAIASGYSGKAVVATYTVAHGRDGAAESGLVICDLPDGRRCYGRVTEPALLAALETDEWVGRTVSLVETEGGVNMVKVA
jgi:acetyl-CoA C-acetyltransferase